MNLDDSRIRRLILSVRPDIPPRDFEVSEVNHGDLIGFWYRRLDGTVQTGRSIAIKRTEQEIAEEILTEMMTEEARRLVTDIPAHYVLTVAASPYEGKRGKHPNNCTCSKHLKADGQA